MNPFLAGVFWGSQNRNWIEGSGYLGLVKFKAIIRVRFVWIFPVGSFLLILPTNLQGGTLSVVNGVTVISPINGSEVKMGFTGVISPRNQWSYLGPYENTWWAHRGRTSGRIDDDFFQV